MVPTQSTTPRTDATKHTPIVPSNFTTGAPVCAPVAHKVMRGEWVIDGVTYANFPYAAKALGTSEARMSALFPFDTKRAATAAWLAIHHAPHAFTVGQEVWLRKSIPAQVLACTYTHAVVLYSDTGIAVKQRVLLSQVQARESEVA